MAACAACGEENPPAASFCLACGTRLARAAPAPPSSRRTVTVLFCDVAESTRLGERLDPESLRRVMSRWFEEMRAVVEAHGGTVEKFAGDAVMAVFGVPAVHEDDALRAARTAVDMRSALGRLNAELEREWDVRLQLRIGVNTGEVVAGDPASGQTFVTGDAVNTAKRLEQAARSGEILIGAATRRLVENAALLEPREPVAAKGKADAVEAWGLLATIAGASGYARRLDTPLVGRERELARVLEELEGAIAAGECRLLTVLGPAGIGKSRLAAEVQARTGDVAVLTARCPAYGDGITFWPLAELVRSLGADEALAAALAGEPDGELVLEQVRGLLGPGGSSQAEEAFWGVRRLLESLARSRPLLLCLEDIHWAQPTFLDLVEYVARWSRGVPLLLLCLARPELLDERPAWLAAGSTLTLGPLSAAESERLVDALGREWPLPEGARARILEAAEGNPLFVEQLVATLAEGGSESEVPPTIQALLAARLDRLPRIERAALERGSVLGKDFTRAALAELAPPEERASVGAALLSLVRRDLIRPAPAEAAGDDGYRFRHVLIRDAAYAGVPKEVRSDLHERAAAWLEAGSSDAELVAYHLEEAFRLREQLGPLDEHARALGRRAAELLGEAGHRAFLRDDMPAAARLLERGVALGCGPRSQRELSRALWSAGEVERADALLAGAVEAALAAGNRREEWLGVLEQAARRSVEDPEPGLESMLAVAEQAVAVFDELDDDAGRARAWLYVSSGNRLRYRFAAAEEAATLGLGYARRGGESQEEARLVDELCTSLLYGPAPVEDAVARCHDLLEVAAERRQMRANVLSSLAGLRALAGGFEEAAELLAEARRVYEELGFRFALAGLSQVAGAVSSLAGDPAAAERELRVGLEILGGVGARSLQAAHVAHALLDQGLVAEAAPLVAEAEPGSGTADVGHQVFWRTARARLLAEQGSLDAALPLAREAAGLLAATDAVWIHADVELLLADLLDRADEPDAAGEAAQRARELYEAKGHRVGTRAAEARLERLAAAR